MNKSYRTPRGTCGYTVTAARRVENIWSIFYPQICVFWKNIAEQLRHRLHSTCRDLAVSIAPCVVLPNSAGIPRHITFHAARHTFATTLCLSQGIPLSTVSKMLGHKQITTTLFYAQTTPIMIEDAIDRVESRLGGKFAA